MNHRCITDIFPTYYPSIPDERDVEKLCRAHFHAAQTLDDLTRWIHHKPCPYLREAYAEGMFTLVQQNDTDDDGEFRVNAAVREDLDATLSRIIRCARTDQLAEEMYIREQPTAPSPLPIATPMAHEQAMEAQLHYLTQEVEQIKKEMAQSKHHTTLLWPTYAPGVEEGDKQAFESALNEYCHSNRRDMSATIRQYLKRKALDGIIIRPAQINTEWEILRKFGYPYAEKTYYNS